MNIFNSLGSNYSLGFALRALFVRDEDRVRARLVDFLEKRYGGEVFLTYKGREALRLAFRMVGKRGKKTTVAICGFTCYAVYEACVKEGMGVEYLDIERETLNFSFEALRRRCEENPEIGVVVVQNTLGIACEIGKIADFCKKRGIVLVEDLAHSIGLVYGDGREAGTVGDFVVLSFSQDKMVDGVSGGALVVRGDKFRDSSNFEFARVDSGRQMRDRFYPLFTWVIRRTYGVGLGKALHLILKRLDLLSKPMGEAQGDVIYGLANWYCGLVYEQFMGLKKDLAHRRRIAEIYAKELHEEVRVSANLRFPVFVDKRGELIRFLKGKGIFVSDIWYDSPIAPRRFLKMTDYKKGMCPESEEVADIIVNLPTHRGVSEKDAEYIASKVSEF